MTDLPSDNSGRGGVGWRVQHGSQGIGRELHNAEVDPLSVKGMPFLKKMYLRKSLALELLGVEGNLNMH